MISFEFDDHTIHNDEWITFSKSDSNLTKSNKTGHN